LAQLVLTLEELEEDYSKDREPSCYLALEAMTTLIKNMRENNLSDAEVLNQSISVQALSI